MPQSKKSTFQMPIWLATLFLVSVFCHEATASTPSYTSVRALDEYGNSVQLKHASEAVQRHGRLVLAGQSSSDETVVVSFGARPLLHPITLFIGDDSVSNTVAICCTGVKGDANWLVGQMQSHSKRVWERYNHPLDAAAAAHAVSRLLGSFNGDDIKQEWQSSVPREKAQWARPLGIQTMLMSQNMPILMVEPTGRVLSTTKDGPSIGIMGKNSQTLKEKISREAPKVMETSELQEFFIRLLLQDVPRNDVAEVIVEILSRQGVQTSNLKFKNGKQIFAKPGKS